MTSTRGSVTHAGHGGNGGTITRAFNTNFACIGCADAVERTLRSNPHVAGVHIDYPARTVHVTYHDGMIAPAAIQALISDAALGCRCAPADTPGSAVG